MVPSISKVIGSEWLELVPVRVGGVPSDQRSPDRYVTLAAADRPLLRVDVYAYGPDVFAFQDAIVWHDNLVIGFGSHVHVVALSDHSTVTVSLGQYQYYNGLYPTPNYLLIASCDRLFRMEPDRSILWRTDVLAVDGVLVHDPGPPIIVGDAEQDPPGGWEPFTVSASDGHTLSPDRAQRGEPDRSVNHDKLVAMPSEVGVSRESIDEATRQRHLQGASEQVLRRRRWRLALHAFSFGLVNTYLFTSNTAAGQWWVLVPVFSWALALTFHARFVLSRE